MRDFGLETYFTEARFKTRSNLTASDAESLTLPELLEMAEPQDREAYQALKLDYTDSLGAADLREVIANQYPGLGRENILCVSGAQEGIYATMRALLRREDHVIAHVPNYQASETTPLDICEVSGVSLKEDQDWQIDLEELERLIRPNTKLVSINFPNNPTGATLRPVVFNGLIDLCRKHGLWMFSDEVYRGLETDPGRRMPPAAVLYEKAITLNATSKAYGLPGLRLGWLASQDAEVLNKINQYKNYLSISCAGPSERLAVIALKAAEAILARNLAIVSDNFVQLDLFFARYPELFNWRRPDGGCVGYPQYLGQDGAEHFCRRALDEEGVLLFPPSLYRSELLPTKNDRFRIGFGRRNTPDGLAALSRCIDRGRVSRRND